MNPTFGNVDGKPMTIRQDGWVDFSNTNRANVIFYKKSVIDRAKSEDAGRPVYVSIDYVRVQQPGEVDVMDCPIKDNQKAVHMFPNQYMKFIQNEDQDVPDGTPTEVLFPNFPEIPANLHTCGIHTVEQLAGLTAPALQNVGMGATEWQVKAVKFLNSAKGGQEYHKLTKTIDELKSQNEVLQNQLSLVKQQLDRVAAAQQGVPSAMIPLNRPTVGQAYTESVHPIESFPAIEDLSYSGPFNQEPPKAPTRSNRKG